MDAEPARLCCSRVFPPVMIGVMIGAIKTYVSQLGL
jgi:hypothetical protein